MEYKICKTCKENKEIAAFYFRPDQKRYRTECKKCESERKALGLKPV